MSFLRAAGVGLIVFAFAKGGFSAAAALSPEQAKMLDAAREFALGYSDRLPNFICSQITSRSSSSQKIPATIESRGRSPAVLPQPGISGGGDRIVEQLTYFNQRENYEVVSIDGKPAPGVDHLQLTGAISAGEFGTALHDIFDPASGAKFDWHGMASRRGHRAYVFEFRVPKETGIEVRDEQRRADVLVGYDGLVFVDADNREVLRMTTTLEVPAGLSITAAERSVDYEPVQIADKKYTLPVRSEVMLQNEDFRFDNKIEFKDYRKFGAESTIHYDDAVPPDEH